MKRRKRLFFDLDDTCVNTTERVIEYINERIPSVNLKMEDITDYNIELALPKEHRWIVDLAFKDKEMWKGVKLLPMCAEILEQLWREQYEIFFATASLPENLRKKINHFSRNTPFFPHGYVERCTINIKDKYLLNGDILIDDCLRHAIHPERAYWSIIKDNPWNKLKEPIERTVRAVDWNDIYYNIHMIDKLISEQEEAEDMFTKGLKDYVKERCL